MRSTRLLLNRCDRIRVAGIDGDLGAVVSREGQFRLVDVDGGDAQPHRTGVLHGDVSESTDPRDDHPLARRGVGHLQSLVHRDTGAQDRRHVGAVDAVGNPRCEPLIDEHVLAEAPVHRVAAVALVRAEGLPSRPAELARAARAPQPRVADTVAHAHAVDIVAELDDDAAPLMSGDQVGLRGDGPVSARGVEVGVADAARQDPDERLAGSGAGDRHIADLQWCVRCHDHGGAHRAQGVHPSLGAGCQGRHGGHFTHILRRSDAVLIGGYSCGQTTSRGTDADRRDRG